jgi:hypothetical protein
MMGGVEFRNKFVRKVLVVGKDCSGHNSKALRTKCVIILWLNIRNELKCHLSRVSEATSAGYLL